MTEIRNYDMTHEKYNRIRGKEAGKIRWWERHEGRKTEIDKLLTKGRKIRKQGKKSRKEEWNVVRRKKEQERQKIKKQRNSVRR